METPWWEVGPAILRRSPSAALPPRHPGCLATKTGPGGETCFNGHWRNVAGITSGKKPRGFCDVQVGCGPGRAKGALGGILNYQGDNSLLG